MTFAVSPGIYTKETDVSGIAEPFVGTNGSYAGKFAWGPCLERVRIANEESLSVRFGKPGTNTDNAIDFFVAAQYLSYATALDVVRIVSYDADTSTYHSKNSVAQVYYNNTVGAVSIVEQGITILNDADYVEKSYANLSFNTFMGKYTGEFGNNLSISFVANVPATGPLSGLNQDQYKFSVDLSGVKNRYQLSRSKEIKYTRSSVALTARSFFDLGDWLYIDGKGYQVKDITLDTNEQKVYTLNVGTAGSGYIDAPIVTIDAPVSGIRATATASMGVLSAKNAGGSGYTNGAHTLTITGGGGTGATGTATIVAGALDSVTITNAGTGYTSVPTIALPVSAGAGTGATFTTSLKVVSLLITNPGTNYASAPVVTIAAPVSGVPALATSALGAIDTITLDRLYDGVVSTGVNQYNYTNTNIETFVKRWRWSNVISTAPSDSSIHVIVYDRTGIITGVAGSVIEKYTDLSFDSVAKSVDGVSNYWINRINTLSEYIRVGTKDIATIPLYATILSKDWISNSLRLVGGDDSFTTMSLDDDIRGYDLFKNPEETDAPIIIGNYRSIKDENGIPNAVLANYLIQNIAEYRRDTVVFLSCRRESVVKNPRKEVKSIILDAETLPSTSYATLDSGWKYIYDKYNDRYLWVPTSGDHAGVYSRVDRIRDPWYSGAGEQRGLLNNVVKLAFNPNEVERDQLYPNRINPIVTFPGVGTMVYGDKTLLALSSSFNRIPTRRMFIVVEKTLANAARFAMFEFNDAITRAQVYGILDSYLRNVKGRRGVDDYFIDVSDKVNTPTVVALNQFKGRVYIKPKYSINFIELNFINVGAVLSFDEAISLVS
jgi:hypothetical protein